MEEHTPIEVGTQLTFIQLSPTDDRPQLPVGIYIIKYIAREEAVHYDQAITNPKA